MRGRTAIGLGATFVVVVCGCSGDPAPSSTIEQPKGGSGGMAGTAGTLNLDVGGGGASGGGAGGGGGASGAAGSTITGVAGSTAGTTQGGAAGSHGGGSSNGGTSVGGSGSGGSKPAGTCKRASGNDADCADFDDTTPQAYACDDASAYSALNGMHGGVCYSVNFVTGSQHGACCPP